MARCLLLLVLLATPAARAAEGMFLPDAVPADVLAEMTRHGLALDAKALWDVSRAVVQVAGGGTGSFVSAEGLVVTNHHVAYGCLAALDATEEHRGILEAGFVAPDRAGEPACPGYYLLILEEARDITAGVRRAGRKARGWHERFEAERRHKEELVAACQASKEHVCEARDFDGGRLVRLMVYTRLRDVRLVYAPEAAIGKFGGDIDNWRFPRHTGDYSFLRAWKDGAPYAPGTFLRVSTDGVKRGDLTLVLGYPGRTARWTSAAGARDQIVRMNPWRRLHYGRLIRILEGLGAAYDEVERRYAGLVAGLNNAVKYYQDLEAGFASADLFARKQAAEAALRSRLGGRAAEDFAALGAEMSRIYGDLAVYGERMALLERMTAVGSTTLRFAQTLARWGVEKQKPDAERRDERFKDKNVVAIHEASDRLELTADLRAEHALLTYWLNVALGLPEGQQLRAVLRLMERVAPASPNAWQPPEQAARAAWQLLTTSRVVSWDGAETGELKSRRRQWLELDGPSIAALEDPLLVFGRELDAELRELEEGPYREVEERLGGELKRAWVELQAPAYPDANFTLRLSWGTVEDYHETATGQDHRYVTDLAGMLAKETGADPFVVPPALKAAATDPGPWRDPAIGDVPVNFTATLDTTGGNSGSPVLDAQGRLVGLLFDGTPESILSDWWFDATFQRSICVDIRYALFLADRVHDATRVLAELGLE
ncbi:MAG: S46 family peptidase [Deltaproteobacteria bacterium]|nr:S46 family peptidase [Deltaproteobacteria bacterium]